MVDTPPGKDNSELLSCMENLLPKVLNLDVKEDLIYLEKTNCPSKKKAHKNSQGESTLITSLSDQRGTENAAPAQAIKEIGI